MNSHELQQKIQAGDREAFRALYGVCGPRTYRRALDALKDESAARSVVKQVFLSLYHEIQTSQQPLDIDARLLALTDGEIRTAKLLRGDFTAAVQSAEPAAPTQSEPRKQPAAPTQSEPRKQPAAPVQSEPQKQPAAPAAESAVPPRGEASPLSRAESYMAAEEDVPGRKRKKRKDARPERGHNRGNGFITFLIIVFLLLFLWVLAGILMDLSILPRVDLGFSWFNEKIFPLFKL